MCNLKNNGINEPICKTEIELQMQKTNMVTKGEWEGGINWETGTDINTLLNRKQITNKNMLYSIGNSVQYSAMTYLGTESKKRVDTCILITDSLCYRAETNTLYINYIPTKINLNKRQQQQNSIPDPVQNI